MFGSMITFVALALATISSVVALPTGPSLQPAPAAVLSVRHIHPNLQPALASAPVVPARAPAPAMPSQHVPVASVGPVGPVASAPYIYQTRASAHPMPARQNHSSVLMPISLPSPIYARSASASTSTSASASSTSGDIVSHVMVDNKPWTYTIHAHDTPHVIRPMPTTLATMIAMEKREAHRHLPVPFPSSANHTLPLPRSAPAPADPSATSASSPVIFDSISTPSDAAETTPVARIIPAHTPSRFASPPGSLAVSLPSARSYPSPFSGSLARPSHSHSQSQTNDIHHAVETMSAPFLGQFGPSSLPDGLQLPKEMPSPSPELFPSQFGAPSLPGLPLPTEMPSPSPSHDRLPLSLSLSLSIRQLVPLPLPQSQPTNTPHTQTEADTISTSTWSVETPTTATTEPMFSILPFTGPLTPIPTLF
ncbi:hypothetical protein A1O3_08581 [Capronia epimyces CBS 606.96]|uniref:Uncharacterized protein n=1 Tax=Capronia epimyces CBS 606.96 TaxID=1182542 RepID=W9XP28_9EURO|nr:uncharacterized protein A1O3_08581 [Capronia epimyces CBS 606.96]EXJ79080.1 hypothetical protein A1O3_08581 [Capronia epimyces CBS 606.96]